MDTSEFIQECSACGEEIEYMFNGYCADCYDERQNELNLHNAQYDYWNSLSDKEKDDQIRWSSNYYG